MMVVTFAVAKVNASQEATAKVQAEVAPEVVSKPKTYKFPCRWIEVGRNSHGELEYCYIVAAYNYSPTRFDEVMKELTTDEYFRYRKFFDEHRVRVE